MRLEAASSPTIMSLIRADPTRSSARRMGRPIMDGNTGRDGMLYISAC